MVLEYQDDPKVYSQDLQYFFGKELLVAPICTKTSSREVYLPAGEWTDYFTGTKYQGPKTITYQSPLDRIPVFVRAGAIIPMGPEVNYVGEKPADPLTLDIYPSGTSSFTLYEDDGISYDYEKGVFAVTDITCTAGSGVITVGIDKKKGEYKTAGRSYILKLNGIGEPNDVAAGGKSLKPCADAQQFESASTGWWYDSVKKTLWAKPGIVKPENGGKVSIIAAKPI